jgi:hypothetical protein
MFLLRLLHDHGQCGTGLRHRVRPPDGLVNAVTVTPEAEWFVVSVRLIEGMLLPADVNAPDVAQLLKSGLIEAVKPEETNG